MYSRKSIRQDNVGTQFPTNTETTHLVVIVKDWMSRLVSG